MRAAWWLSCLMVVAIFGGVALSVVGDAEPTTKRIQCVDEETKKQIHEILMRGLDYSLQVRVMNLFDVWMEHNRAGQAERAGKGIEKGIDAYLHARQQFLAWDMPTCVNRSR